MSLRSENCHWLLLEWRSSGRHFHETIEGGAISQVEEDAWYDAIWKYWFKGGNVRSLNQDFLGFSLFYLGNYLYCCLVVIFYY